MSGLAWVSWLPMGKDEWSPGWVLSLCIVKESMKEIRLLLGRGNRQLFKINTNPIQLLSYYELSFPMDLVQGLYTGTFKVCLEPKFLNFQAHLSVFHSFCFDHSLYTQHSYILLHAGFICLEYLSQSLPSTFIPEKLLFILQSPASMFLRVKTRQK